jgi:hypothetical protein
MLGHRHAPVGTSDAHTHSRAPDPGDRPTRCNSGSMSPRDPYAGNNTRILVTPVSVVLA